MLALRIWLGRRRGILIERRADSLHHAARSCSSTSMGDQRPGVLDAPVLEELTKPVSVSTLHGRPYHW